MNQEFQDQQSQKQQLRISPTRWILLIIFMIWNAITYLKAVPPEVNIPYSTFIEQVRSGNVTSILIQGNQISGTLSKPLTWPQPAPGATPAAAAVQSEPQYYTDFAALFPDSIGDPALLNLLEEKGIQVQVENPSLPWFTIRLTDGLPLLLLVLVMGRIGRRAMQSQQGIFSFGRTRARQILPDQPSVTFEGVA